MTTQASKNLRPGALTESARHLLGYYHKPGGYMPGGFTTKLIELFEKADPINRAKLAAVYPEISHVAALLERGHEDEVRAIAEGRAGA